MLIQKPQSNASVTTVNISYTDTMLEVPQVGSSVADDQPEQLGINPHRAHSWHSNTTGGELSSAEIYLNQTITAALMKKHNYSLRLNTAEYRELSIPSIDISCKIGRCVPL